MKKFTSLFAILFMATTLSAQLANPNGSDGNMTFIWDCENGTFATDLPSNAYELNETFTFAVDVTGTPLADWLAESEEGKYKSIGFLFWNDHGGGGGQSDGRLARIRGNIFGADLNFAQFLNDRNSNMLEGATTSEEVLYIYGTLFGFASDGLTNHGIDWYKLPQEAVVEFQTAPYTGAKEGVIFFNDDFEPGLYADGEFGTWMGYAYPCVVPKDATDIQSVTNDAETVGYEYYDLLGNRLVNFPQKGIYIERALKADGTSTSTKVLR